MNSRIQLTLCLLLAASVGCEPGSDVPDAAVVAVSSPGAVGSRRPVLTKHSSGRVLMSWTEPSPADAGAGERDRIAWAVYDGRTWSSVETFVHSNRLFTNWADTQNLIRTGEGRLVGTWGVHAGPSGLATNLMVASRDPESPEFREQQVHGDDTATQHGFATITETDAGTLVAWLDGRETMLSEGVTDESEWGNMTLRAAWLDSRGRPVDDVLLDERVCDCCPTAAVRTKSGALVAYRDRSDGERRDIHLIRFENGMHTEPYPLHDDGWTIRGCPVNGPALAAAGDRVAAAWFTAPDDRPVVKAAFSNDGGRTFTDPVIVDENRPSGRVDVALLQDGSAAVTWIGRDESRSVLKAARVTEDGRDTARIVARPESPSFVGIPAVGPLKNGVLVAWTDGPDPDSTRVRVARVRL